MGKPLVIGLFLALLAVALYVFFSHDRTNLRDSVKDVAVREPRVVLEDFIVYRTEGSELKSTWSARIAQVYEPNVVELNGDVLGIRHLPNGQEERVGGESAVAFFDAQTLSSMMGTSKLVRAELKGFVELSGKGYVLTTDFAEYFAETEMLQSSRPVHVDSRTGQFDGENGFKYELSAEKIEIFGRTKGFFKPESKSL